MFVLTGQDLNIITISSLIANNTNYSLSGQDIGIGTATLIATTGLTINTNTVTLDENIINYNPEDYSPNRVLYLTAQNTNNTVHIQPESRTVTIAPQDNRTSVYIAA